MNSIEARENVKKDFIEMIEQYSIQEIDLDASAHENNLDDMDCLNISVDILGIWNVDIDECDIEERKTLNETLEEIYEDMGI